MQEFQFRCTSGFKGDISNPWPYVFTTPPNTSDGTSDGTSTGTPEVDQFGIAFATDADLTRPAPLVHATPRPDTGGEAPVWPEILQQNPGHFVAWGNNNPNSANADPALLSDPELGSFGPLTLWYLKCSSTVVNATYAWSNGSIHSFDTETISGDMAALFLGEFSVYGYDSTIKTDIQSVFSSIADVASLAYSMTDFAEKWATGFSNAATARAIGAFVPLDNEVEQIRETGVVVARIPLAPLYLLIAVKMIYVVVVIILAIGAYAFTHPAETEVVKAQLSTKGLAAAHFDQPDLLQENAVKAVQSRLDTIQNKRANTTPSAADASKKDPQPGQLIRADTTPGQIEGGKPKVGIVANADGAWTFAVMANGVWHSISPFVMNVIETQAKQGNLGGVGGVINAWK
jgi:hypothetical protein